MDLVTRRTAALPVVRRLTGWLCGVVLLSCLCPAVVRADKRTDARRYFRRGMALIAEGKEARDPDRVEEGIAQLMQAYEILPHPNVLYNVARAYVDLGDYDKALDFFQRYLDSDPEDRDLVERYIAALQERIAARRQAEEAAARQEAEAAAAQQEAEAPSEGASSAPVANEEEIANLEAAAERLEQLAQATGSAELRERAGSLRTLAQTLRTRLEASSEAATPGGAQEEAPGAEQTPSEASSSPSEGTASRGEGLANAEDVLGGADGEVAAKAEDVYEEQVVSSSRVAESPLHAPNSTAALTAQDLRMAGLLNPLENLRRIAGVDLMQLSPGHTQFSIRGLNERISSRVIVLVDGRTVYLDFLGMSLWSTVPLSSEDVERIEVVRGPASAIYGADALTGVVNIITRRPGDGDSYVSMGAGSHGQLRAVTGVYGRAGKLRLRVGGGYEAAEPFSVWVARGRQDVVPGFTDYEQGYRRRYGHLSGEMRLARGVVMRGGAGVSQFDQSIQGIGRLGEVLVRKGFFSQSYLELGTRAGLSARVFWNRFATDYALVEHPLGAVPAAAGGRVREQDALDGELVFARDFKLARRIGMQLVAGLSYRFKYIDWDWIAPDPETGRRVRSQHHFAAFVQDRLRFGKRVEVVGSVRADRHPLLDGIQVSPRGSVLYHPTKDQVLRLMVATAFRGPTFLESYLQIPNITPLRGATIFGVGNTNLDPERLFSLELGYRAEDPDAFALEANAYFNRVGGLIGLRDLRFARLRDFVDDPAYAFDPDQSVLSLGGLRFTNEATDFLQFGGELGIRLFPVQGLDVYANYAFHRTVPATDVPLGGREDDQRTSEHKVNLGVQYRSRFGLDVAADFSWVSAQVWVDPQVVLRPGESPFKADALPAYAVLNARVGYRLFDDKLELSAVGTNLLMEHREHPFAQTIDRRVMGHATLRF